MYYVCVAALQAEQNALMGCSFPTLGLKEKMVSSNLVCKRIVGNQNTMSQMIVIFAL